MFCWRDKHSNTLSWIWNSQDRCYLIHNEDMPLTILFQHKQTITRYASDLRFNNSSHLYKMADILADDNPLQELILTQFIDAYMRH